MKQNNQTKQQQLNKLAAQLRRSADNITEANKAEIWEQFKQTFKLYSEITTDYLTEMQKRLGQ